MHLGQGCSEIVQLNRHKTVANDDTAMEVMKENTVPNDQVIVPAPQSSDVIEAGTSGSSHVNAIESMAKGMSE